MERLGITADRAQIGPEGWRSLGRQLVRNEMPVASTLLDFSGPCPGLGTPLSSLPSIHANPRRTSPLVMYRRDAGMGRRVFRVARTTYNQAMMTYSLEKIGACLITKPRIHGGESPSKALYLILEFTRGTPWSWKSVIIEG